jgi:hypothetical protein
MTMAKNQKDQEALLKQEVSAEVVTTAPAAEPAPAEEPAKAVKKEIEPLAVVEGQLNVYEGRVINVPEGARVTVVENIGFGDLYVDNTTIEYTSNYCVAPGQKKEYKNAKHVFLGSASRPEYRISFYK